MDYNYCPVCAGQLHKTTLPPVCTKCGFIFYQNSKPTASAIIINKNSEVLIAQRGVEPFKGDWDCIGGFLEDGEDPIEGVKRELKEEIGVECKVLQFLDIIVDRYNGIATLNIYYHVQLGSGDISPQDDIDDVQWFPITALPPNLAFENNRKILTKVKGMLESGVLQV